MALPRSDRMSDGEVFSYARHQPEQKLLYPLVERHWPDFQSYLSESGSVLPRHVRREFDEYLECGRLENGFLRVRCEDCHLEHLVAFSGPFLRIHAPTALVIPFTSSRRGFCPGCGVSRLAETAALLVDDVLPHKPIRQWVLSFPFPLRFLLANNPSVMTSVLDIAIRAMSTHLTHKAGFKKTEAQTGQ